MNSPFKLKSPLLKEEKNQTLGGLSSESMKGQTFNMPSQKSTANITAELGNNTGGTTPVVSESPNETAKRNASVTNKGKGTTAFDRDGRSVDKFDQRIEHAESKGKLGRAQRLRNRKSGFMESQANKLERAGGTLTNDQKIALNEASSESGGTRVGRALRVLGGREAKQRKVDPVSLPVSKVNEVTHDNKDVSLGENFMNKPDFSAVTKKNGLSDKERALRRQASGDYNEDGTPKSKKERDNE
tara:strand:+ start:156 stop:884 length:729 start_codon:yes stop_codon:yes gene_type:complete